MHLRLQVMQLR